MNKTLAILMASAFLTAGSAFAAQEGVTGKSTLKLSPAGEENVVRNARQGIAAIDKEMVILDSEITEARNQALTYQALNNNGKALAKQMETLATAKEMQKSRLASERSQLQAVIQAD